MWTLGEGSLTVNQEDNTVHNYTHCLSPCVQVISGWPMALSLQRGGWSCSMKENGRECVFGLQQQ